MKNPFTISLLTAAFAALTFSSPSALGQAIFSSGHGDIGVGYAAGEFDPHWHLHSGAIVDGSPLGADEEFAPADLNAQTFATRTSPSGLSSIIGVADGTVISAAGSSLYQPNLGFGTEELTPSDWIGPITVALTSWNVPIGANFALYTTNLAGTTVVDRVFSTFAPGSTDFSNSFTMTPGDHMHFQWGFSELGTYQLELTWSGTHAVDGAISTSENLAVQVIPEPSTYALLGLGLVGILWALRRRTA